MVERNKRICLIVVFSVVYVLLGKLGLSLAVVNPSATAVWPNSGLAVAALLATRYSVWPGVLFGAFLVNLSTTGLVLSSIGIAAGNTLEGVVGAWLTFRFAGGMEAVFRTRRILKFLALAGFLSTALSATIGVFSLVGAGLESMDRFWPVWLAWWLGDATGVIVVAPVVLLAFAPRGNPWRWFQLRPEAVALLVSAFVAGHVIFEGIFAPNYSLTYLCMPFFAWAAFRFGQREAAVIMLIFAASAVRATFYGVSAYDNASLQDSLLILQVFVGVGAVTNIVLATEVAERRRAEAEARELSMLDPLTGLGNHRGFINHLDSEVRRAERSGRSFAILLFDLDGLKRINDTLGHLAGNRALCRMADVIRNSSRGGDTTARFGGDEFAMLLPESDYETARRVAGRIKRRLKNSGEAPTLSVSVGVGVWPDDGITMEALLHAADSDLYVMKKRRGVLAARVESNRFGISA